jgi:hypothetical protein
MTVDALIRVVAGMIWVLLALALLSFVFVIH